MSPLVRRRDLPSPSPQRWQPFPELQDIQEQMGELMQRVMPGDSTVWVPLVDIEETEDSWIVEAEVPGAKRDEINVEMGDGELVVTGDIKERERKGILRRKTRRVGRFEFRVTLPGQSDPGNIDADLDHGVLTIRIPKPEASRPRRIEVRSGQTPGEEPATAP
jgi:HSP20 family protein